MKNLLKFFHINNKKTAKMAKERLQIVVSHQRVDDTSPEFLPSLRKELLDVISKYIAIDPEKINVNLQREGNCSILELNVSIPEPVRNINLKNKEPHIKKPIINKHAAKENKVLNIEIADV
jgi:cell division topological specificity factor